MKKVLLTVLVAGLLASAANAGTFRMNWAGGDQLAEMDISDTAVIEVWVDLLAGESVSTLAYSNSSTGAVSQTDVTTPIPNWGIGGVHGPLDGSQQLAVAADAPIPTNSIHGPGSFILALQTIHLDAGNPSDVIEVYGAVNGDATFLLLNESGGGFAWDARYNTYSPGYMAWGDWGNPGWGTNPLKGHQPTPNPLLIHVVPEPGTLALLALGCLGILRRR